MGKDSTARAAPLTPSWHLYLGDAIAGMAELPDRSVDVFLTDPPYSEHVHSASRRGCIEPEPGTGRATFNRNRELGFASLTPELMEAAAREFKRLARRWVLVFSDTESDYLWRQALQRAGLEYVRTCFWDKVGGTPQFTGDRPAVACEAITCAHRAGRKHWNGGGKRGIYHVPIALERGDGTERIHTTQKPLRLGDELIADFTDPGDLVADPFAGSATFLCSAKRYSRPAIGWEIDAAFHGDASQRLRAERTGVVWTPYRGPKPKQQGLGFTSGVAPQALSLRVDPEEAA